MSSYNCQEIQLKEFAAFVTLISVDSILLTFSLTIREAGNENVFVRSRKEIKYFFPESR